MGNISNLYFEPSVIDTKYICLMSLYKFHILLVCESTKNYHSQFSKISRKK